MLNDGIGKVLTIMVASLILKYIKENDEIMTNYVNYFEENNEMMAELCRDEIILF